MNAIVMTFAETSNHRLYQRKLETQSDQDIYLVVADEFRKNQHRITIHVCGPNHLPGTTTTLRDPAAPVQNMSGMTVKFVIPVEMTLFVVEGIDVHAGVVLLEAAVRKPDDSSWIELEVVIRPREDTLYHPMQSQKDSPTTETNHTVSKTTLTATDLVTAQRVNATVWQNSR